MALLGTCESGDTGEFVGGAGLGSRRSAGCGAAARAGSGVVGRSKGGVCLARSFKGVLEELRRDNDASHERDCGAGVGAGASGAPNDLTALVPGAVVSSAGEDE